MTNLRVKLLSKLDSDSLEDFIKDRVEDRYGDLHIDERLIIDLAQLNVERLDILDSLWQEYSYWMILHFKNRITKDQLDRLLDNQHIVSAMAHLLDEEQVSRVIMNGMFGLHVGDILKHNVHYKRKYGVF